MPMDLAIDADELRAWGVGAAVGGVLGLLAGGRKNAGAGLLFGAAAGVVAGGLASVQINTFLDAQTWLKSGVGSSVAGAAEAAMNELTGP